MVRRLAGRALAIALAIACVAGAARPALAVMDIEDRGPVMKAGKFSLRVSNVGVIGNPWFDNGRSFDPSWEYPSGSGHELLGHAELWVGALDGNGARHVSGGPMLEWRPTLDANDRVRQLGAGAPGGLWRVDDDHDGRVDEEAVNGLDDDGDGQVDEDFDLPSQEMFTAEYVDDRPEAVNYGYEGGEQHVPLGLSVHQESFVWNRPGLDAIACLRFVVTNHGTRRLTDLRMGLYADLDSRGRNESGGHLDDRLLRVPYRQVTAKPDSRVNAGGFWTKACFDVIEGTAVAVADSRESSGLPVGAIVPLSHSTDALGLFTNDAFPGVAAARAQARAPARDSTFHVYTYSPSLPPHQGGPPVLDTERWEALAGTFQGAHEDVAQDYSVLVTCGPFVRLDPGQSVEFSVALVAAATLDSIPARAIAARRLQRGARYNLQPDTTSASWFRGTSGLNGHEECYAPPEGVTFWYDPHCPQKFYDDPAEIPDPLTQGPGVSFEIPYVPGHCVWTDLDCDACTGMDGTDTAHRWSILSLLPPPPHMRASATDSRAVIEWDDWPETALGAGLVGDPGIRFEGYKLYRLDDWRRDGLLPSPEKWQRVAVFDASSLSRITDAGSPVERFVNGVPQHAIGRYAFVDSTVHNGFDYSYVVTSVIRMHAPYDTLPGYQAVLESSFEPNFDERVVPHVAAGARGGHVWVAPNPYRGGAQWERPAVPGDVFTRHVDFMGLPRERCTIRIYTLAGDLVAEVPHDGTAGDGQASWNLISRNGQDVASGVYLFVVEGPGTHAVGRFVIMR